MESTPIISVVVPLYNEAENIELLYEDLKQALENLALSYEILLVDDGSKDDTFAISSAIAAHDPHLRIIKLNKNFGQTAAFAAGIEHARGEVLITMDGDLQNDPADIPNLLDKLDEGYDVVVGWRYRRQDALYSRKIPSLLANWIINKVTGIPVHDNGCSLKAFRREIARSMPIYADMHRFLPAAASISGARIAEIKVQHHARRYGKSKYGLSRIYKVMLDLLRVQTITSFAAQTLLRFSLPAVLFAVLGIALLGYAAIAEHDTAIFPLIGTGLLFMMVAMLLLLSGLLAELISRSFPHSNQKIMSIDVRHLDNNRKHSKKASPKEGNLKESKL